jgi:hypothetical protein
MSAKLLKFPEPKKKAEPVGEPIELPGISISFGDEVYSLALTGVITRERGGQSARPAKEPGAPVDKLPTS